MNVLDRKQAAEILNVSIRTIDRYIQKGTLKKEEINGRIFIKAKDLKPLLEQKKIQDQYLSELKSLHQDSPPRNSPVENEDGGVGNVIKQEHQSSTYSAELDNGDVYKKLYEELQEELKTKQERLEGANYRVGQLEGLLKESVPLLEYRKAIALEQEKRQELEDMLNTFEKDNELLTQTVESKTTEIKQLGERLTVERFNKKVFIIILVILFLLQPLWLIFPMS